MGEADHFTFVTERFVLGDKVAEGGMGSIYRAIDRETNREVAIKLLKETGNTERFAREIQLLAMLKHPAIVEYVGHGRAGPDYLYLAMEWLEGEDLASRLKREAPSIEDSLALTTRVAEALAFAHRAGVVHRDIKPQNIFLPKGNMADARVLDFGIAYVNAAPVTQSGTIVGTPGYMAPEQVRDAHDIDSRADIFSLGCILYECLCGKPLFTGESIMAILAKILFEEVPRISEARADVPVALDLLLRRMLARDPHARPAHGSALLEALRDMRGEESEGMAVSPRFGDAELRFSAVLLARPSASVDSYDDTIVGDTTTPLEVARSVAAEFRGIAEPLLDGSVVIVLASDRTNAMDRVLAAGRCALELSRRYPMPVALALGRTAATNQQPMGEAIDRAAMIVDSCERNGVFLDSAAEAVMGGRFIIRTSGDESRLVQERPDLATSRVLLGKPTPFVGRDLELATLRAWFEECTAESRSRAAVLTAPPGTGKSRLAQEWFALEHSDNASLILHVVRGDPTRAGAAFGLLSQLIRRSAGIQEGESIERSRPKLLEHVAELGIRDSEVTDFLGELIDVPFEGEGRPALETARRNAKILHARILQSFCAWLEAQCVSAPLVLILEDLHWGDPATVKFVGQALSYLSERPFFVLVLARPEIESSFPRLWEAQGTKGLRLGTLSKKASKTLIESILGDTSSVEVERITRSASGNAFFLEELIRAHATQEAGEIPDTVLAMVSARLERLGAHLRRVLRAASVFGEVFWDASVARVLGDDSEASVATWLSELAELELITPRSGSSFRNTHEYGFRHGLVRDAAYAMMTSKDKVLGHQLAGEWLAHAGEAQARVLAEHFELGQRPQESRVFLVRAAKQALDALDFDQVHAMAIRAIELGVEGEDLQKAYELRGAAAMGLGIWKDAPEHLSKALALVPHEEQEHQADLRLQLAKACFFAFDVEGLESHTHQALALLETQQRPDLLAEAIAGIGTYEQTAGQLDKAAESYRRAKEIAGKRYYSFEAQLLLGLLWRGDFDELVERGESFVRRAEEMKDVFGHLVALPQLALGLVARGNYAQGQAVFDQSVEVGRMHGAIPLVARAIAMSAGYRLDIFDYEGARERATTALEMAKTYSYPATVTSMQIDLLFNAARVGDLALGERLMNETRQLVAASDGQGWHAWLFKMRFEAACAELAIARGEGQRAIEGARQVIAQSRTYQRKKYEIVGQLVLGRGQAILGEAEQAITAWQAALAVARSFDDPALLLQVQLALLSLQPGEDMKAQAIATRDRIVRGLSEDAVVLFEESPVLSVLA